MSETCPRLIDTHLHLIERVRASYSWADGIPALAERDFALPEARALQGDAVAGAIFMESGADDDGYREEARSVAGLVRDGLLLGQIASCRPETDDGFEAWLDECAGLGVVGYRRILHVMPDETSVSGTFRANIRRIGARGLPFDICVLARQLPLALLLARDCPEVTFVLDHCGVPDIAGGGLDPWRADMAALAACPNVNVKLSGLTAYAGGDPAAIGPYVDHVLRVFGPRRMVWGSDWPVVELGAGLTGWLDLTRAILGRLPAGDAQAIAEGNARRIWGVAGG